MSEETVAKKCKLAAYACSSARRKKVSSSSVQKNRCLSKDTQITQSSSESGPAVMFAESKSCVQERGCGGTLDPGSAACQFTPLEEQVLQLKKQNPGLVLMIQNAYMYTFFGEDAEIAANVLKVSSYWSQNFLVAVVPVTRLSVHVHRLVQAGYKVGVVNQIGTSTTKSRKDKHGVFQRELISVYSKTTLVGDDINPLVSSELPVVEGGVANFILCIVEQCSFAEDKFHKMKFGIVTFDPANGEAVCDEFSDGINRCELDKRLEHLKPVEVLVSEDVSENTERLLNHRHVLLDKLPSSVFSSDTSFSELVSLSSSNVEDSAAFQTWKNFNPIILSCVAVLLQHLKTFGLQAALKLSSFRRFTIQDQYLQMDGSTLRNLEIFSSKAHTHKGSLCWVLDHTVTKFGSRLLREWVSMPLRDLQQIQDRQESVQELMESSSDFVDHLQKVLVNLPDLERGLTAILSFKNWR